MDFWTLRRALNGVGGTIVILTQLVIYMTAKFFLVIYDGVRGRGVRSDRGARQTDEGKQVGPRDATGVCALGACHSVPAACKK